MPITNEQDPWAPSGDKLPEDHPGYGVECWHLLKPETQERLAQLLEQKAIDAAAGRFDEDEEL